MKKLLTLLLTATMLLAGCGKAQTVTNNTDVKEDVEDSIELDDSNNVDESYLLDDSEEESESSEAQTSQSKDTGTKGYLYDIDGNVLAEFDKELVETHETAQSILEALGIEDPTSSTCEVYKVVIPEGTTVISDYSFHHCSSIHEVEMPDSVEVIGDSAFMCCNNIEQIKFSSSLREIQLDAFFCSLSENMEEVILPDGLKTIGMFAFDGCKAKSIVLPDSLEIVESDAFHGYKGKVTYNGSLDNVPFGAVKFNEYMDSTGFLVSNYGNTVYVTGIPNDLGEDIVITGYDGIGSYALDHNYTAKRIVVKGDIKNVDNSSLSSLYLTDVVFEDGINNIDKYAIAYTGTVNVTLEGSLGDKYSIGDSNYIELNNQ